MKMPDEFDEALSELRVHCTVTGHDMADDPDLGPYCGTCAEEDPQNEIDRLRALLFRTALAVSDPDKDHVDRLVEVSTIVGSAEDWRT